MWTNWGILLERFFCLVNNWSGFSHLINSVWLHIRNCALCCDFQYLKDSGALSLKQQFKFQRETLTHLSWFPVGLIEVLKQSWSSHFTQLQHCLKTTELATMLTASTLRLLPSPLFSPPPSSSLSSRQDSVIRLWRWGGGGELRGFCFKEREI